MKVQTACRVCAQECPVEIELDEEKRPIAISYIRASEGLVCPKGMHVLDLMEDPRRVKTPLVADTGEDGARIFRKASWEEAVKAAAAGLSGSMEIHGKESIVSVSGFQKRSIQAAYRRFCNAAGIINRCGAENMCHTIQGIASEHTFGTRLEADITPETKVIILWGINPANTTRWKNYSVKRAIECGTKLIFVDPLPGVYAKRADCWLPVRPGTDLALMMGMIHLIIEENRYDKALVCDHTDGFPELCEAAAEYTPEYVSRACGIGTDELSKAVRLISENVPAAFLYGSAVEHNSDCYQKCRAMDLLIALTGSIDIPGGMLSEVPVSPRNRFCSGELALNELLPPESFQKRVGGHYKLTEFNMISGHDAVSAIEEGKLHSMLVDGGDPVVQWADCRATEKALKRLDFMVVIDFFMTLSAQEADVILPSAFYPEFESIIIDENENLMYSPCLSSKYDVLPDAEIFRRLAKEMGLEGFFWKSMEEYWDLIAEPYGTTMEELRIKGFIETEFTHEGRKVHDYRRKGFPTPNGRLQLARHVSGGPDALPSYKRIETSETYPLLCTTYKPAAFFARAGRQACEKTARSLPIAFIGRETAEAYGFKDGDFVQIITPDGRCIQELKVLPRMAADTVAMSNVRRQSEDSLQEGHHEMCANNLTSRSKNIGEDIPAFSCRGIACRIEKIQLV